MIEYIAFPHGGSVAVKRAIHERLVELGWNPLTACWCTTIELETGDAWTTDMCIAEKGDAKHHVGLLWKLFQTDFYRYIPPTYLKLDSKIAAKIHLYVEIRGQKLTFGEIEKIWEDNQNTYPRDKKYIAFPHGDNIEIAKQISNRLADLGWVKPMEGIYTTIDVAAGILANTLSDVAELKTDARHVGSLHALFNTDKYRRKPNSVLLYGVDVPLDVLDSLYKEIKRRKDLLGV